jgi:hypothetical protein
MRPISFSLHRYQNNPCTSPLSGQRVGPQNTTISPLKDMATYEVREVDNKEVVDNIIGIKPNPELPNVG